MSSVTPSRASFRDVLGGRTKVVLAHKSHQHHADLPFLAATVQQAVSDRIGVGTVVRLPRVSQNIASQYLRRFEAEMLKLVDPELYLHAEQWNQATPAMRDRWSYMRESLPTSPDEDWLGDRFNEQLAVGANALLTPGFVVAEANAAQSLAQALAWVQASRRAADERPMFVNLTLRSAWLADSALRGRLLNTLVHQPERHWYLQVHWPQLPHEHAQLQDSAILAGYREIAEVAAAENAVLLLPNSDLVGWLATALGASGFSTGLGPSERRFGDRRVIQQAPDQPARPARERFFEPELLHIIDHGAWGTLSPHLTRSCGCSYCQRQEREATWNQTTANLHYLFCALCLPATHPTGQDALREVQHARAVWQSLPPPAQLTGDDRPTHLPVWEAMLS
jgi:hypothetical protein